MQKYSINYTAPDHPGSRLSPGGRTKLRIRYVFMLLIASEIEQEVLAAINELRRADSDMMSISQFLNPIEEIVEDTPTDIEVSTTGGVNSDT